MNITEKIELFNKLRGELEEVYGEFDTIDLVDEYRGDMRVYDGKHYHDTSGCMEGTPICLVIKRGE